MIGLGKNRMSSTDICHINLQHEHIVHKQPAVPFMVNPGSATCVSTNVVYSTGLGSTPFTNMWKWDVVTGWIRCPDMITGRRYHCVIFVDSTFYVLDGLVENDNTARSSVESYNTKTNKWSSAGHLIHAVLGHWAIAN